MARPAKPTVRKGAPVPEGKRRKARRKETTEARRRAAAVAGTGRRKIAYGDAAPFPISMAVRAGDFVFTSALGDHGFNPNDVVYDGKGLVVSDGTSLPARSVEEETRDVLRNIESALALAGCTLDDVVDSSVWLRDPRDLKAMNSAYREFFRKDCPTRSIFRIDFMFDCRVEIKVIAYKPFAAGGERKTRARSGLGRLPRPGGSSG